jgi:hypothetical protein
VYDGLHNRNGRDPQESDFEDGKTIKVTSKRDFVTMRHNKKVYYVPRKGGLKDLVGIENAAGEIVCSLDPIMAGLLGSKREATAAKVRAKLCKPKVQKPKLVKEPSLRTLTYQLVDKIGYDNWMEIRKWTPNELIVATVVLSALETPEAMHEMVRPLATVWMTLREENIKKFKDMYSDKVVDKIDAMFAKIPLEESKEDKESQEGETLIAI